MRSLRSKRDENYLAPTELAQHFCRLHDSFEMSIYFTISYSEMAYSLPELILQLGVVFI